MDTASRRALADQLATYRRDCPSRTVVEMLANKWTLYVLAALGRSSGPVRFNELRRILDGITQKMLTQTLRSLERDGLVARRVYPSVPPRVEYSLTDTGRAAGQLTTAIKDWAVDHAAGIQASRAQFDARAEEPLQALQVPQPPAN